MCDFANIMFFVFIKCTIVSRYMPRIVILYSFVQLRIRYHYWYSSMNNSIFERKKVNVRVGLTIPKLFPPTTYDGKQIFLIFIWYVHLNIYSRARFDRFRSVCGFGLKSLSFNSRCKILFVRQYDKTFFFCKRNDRNT